MFGTKSKEELIVANAKLEAKIEGLQEQNAQLLKMVDNLTEALIAKQSPEAYADQIADRNRAKDYKAPSNKLAEEEDVIRQYLTQLESGDLMKTGDDLTNLLGLYQTTMTDVSVAGNDES